MPIDPPRRRRSPSYTSPRPSTTLKDSIKIELDFDGDLLVTTPFNKRFVEALKETVDQDSRRWMPDQKAWFVDSAYESEIIALIKKHFGVNMKGKITPKPKTENPHNRFTYSTPGADAKSHIYTAYVDDPNDDSIKWMEYKGEAPAADNKWPGDVGASWWENGPEARPAVDSIEDLTERISVLTYQLKCEKERVEGKERIIQTTRDQVARANATIANLQRVNADLTFKATMAQAAGARGQPGYSFGFSSSANPSPRDAKLAAAYQELHLAPGAPTEVVEATWKALMKAHHSDAVGGNDERAKKINAAHDTIVHKDLPY